MVLLLARACPRRPAAPGTAPAGDPQSRAEAGAERRHPQTTFRLEWPASVAPRDDPGFRLWSERDQKLVSGDQTFATRRGVVEPHLLAHDAHHLCDAAGLGPP